MKKLLLLALVVIGGVMNASADETKTIRFVACDEVGMGEKLYLYVYGTDYIHTAWPGIEPNRCIGSYTKDNNTRYWYEYFVEIPTNKLSNIEWKYTNNNSNWGDGKETVSSGSKNLTSTEYCSWIYAGTYGQNQNLSTAELNYYIWDTSTEATSANLTAMTKVGQEIQTDIDASSIASKKNYLIIPSYAVANGNITYWQFAYRPQTVSGNYLVNSFSNYSYNGEISNSGKNWEFEKVLESTFSFSFDLEDKTFTLNPSFTRTISSLGYATFSSTYDVAVDGATATYITGVGAGNVLEEANFTDGIKANTGALLYKAGGGTVTFTPAASTPTDVSSTNKLVAVSSDIEHLEQTADGKTNYILTNQTKDGGKTIGFYKANSDKTNTVAAGKAYLALSTELASRDFFWFGEEETTGISAIAKENKIIDGYYNLSGQRIAKPSKGLYIVNGKKVIIK